MPLEAGTKISDLNPAWPLGSDPKAQGDDHIRLIKSILQADAVALSDTGSADIAEADIAEGWQIWGDVLIQWGIGNTAADGNLTVTFNQPFKTAPYVTASSTAELGAASGDVVNVTNHSPTVCIIRSRRVSNGGTVTTLVTQVRWVAVGEAPDALKKPKTVQTIGGTDLQEYYDPTGVASWRIVGNTLEVWGAISAGLVTFPKGFAAIPRVTVGGAADAARSGATTAQVTLAGTGSIDYHAIGEWDGVA